MSPFHYQLSGVAPIQQFEIPAGGRFVHNVLESSDEEPPAGYSDFLEYWKEKSGRTVPAECVAVDPHLNKDGTASNVRDIVGAHVRIDGIFCPKNWAWIVPLCKHCNNDDRTWCILIPEGVALVPVKLSQDRETATNELDVWIKFFYRLFGRR